MTANERQNTNKILRKGKTLLKYKHRAEYKCKKYNIIGIITESRKVNTEYSIREITIAK